MTGVALTMDHKEPQVSPPVVIETRKPSTIGKHKIWALVAVLVTLVVIAGIVTTVVVMLNHSDRILEKSVTVQPKPGVKIKETITVNADKRTKEFDVKKTGMKVLYDFKKGLSVYRMPDGRGSHYCIVTVLESDKVQSPEDTYNALNQDSVDEKKIQTVTYDNSTTDEEESDDSTELWYQFTDANVEQRGFLNDDMRAACSGNEMFWGIKSNKPAENQAVSGAKIRNKRGPRYTWYCRFYFTWSGIRYGCYWRLTWTWSWGR